MASEFLIVLSLTKEWLTIARKLEERWQFSNCIGAIDGKQVVMQTPSYAGSHYYNHKHAHSIVLMVEAGPDYKCLNVNVGRNGSLECRCIKYMWLVKGY